MSSFQDGYEYFMKHSSGVLGALDGANYGTDRLLYVENVEKEISVLEGNVNNFLGTKTASNILKGDIAEFWHAGTFNVNAAVNRSENRMMVERSHDFASVDILGKDGQKFGLKYYKNGSESAKEQAKSVFQRFKEYQTAGGKDSLEKYLTDRNYTDIETILNDPIYQGQIRIIPRDQMEEAITWLKRMIQTESTRRPEHVKRYQETLDMLRDKITDVEGNQSTSLSKAKAEELARLAKEGKFDASEFGIIAPELLNFELVLKEAMEAGTTAALISLVLKVGPEIYKTMSYLIKNGEVEEEQLENIGYAALSGSADGFFRGSIAAAITTCCKTGLLGEALKDINPAVVGAVTVLGINIFRNSIQVVLRKKTRMEMADELFQEMFVGTCALIGGGISQAYIEIPVLSYMIGSFVGSVVGSFIYNTGYNATISFCVDSGFTLFGLVDQDYSLPKDIVEKIGISTLEYDTFEPESFNTNTFRVESFDVEEIEPDSIGIKFLRRGVIGVSKIGFVE